MSKTVTIYDVAAAAGVSIATVNRALNNKPRISESTRKRVIKIASELGYTANKAAQALSRKPITIGIIICDTIHEVQQGVLRGMKKAITQLEPLNVRCQFLMTSEANKENEFLQYKRAFELFKKKGVNGIIIFTGYEPLKQKQEINALYDSNIMTATIVTDIPDSRRVLSVRCNGVCEGRMAAEMLDFLCPKSKIAIFASAKNIPICAENLRGFHEGCVSLSIIEGPIFENHDSPILAYKAVDQLIKNYPEVDGIYICSANSDSVCRRIEELGLQGRFKIVATDLFEGVSKNIEKGIINATLFQNLEKQGEVVVKTFYKKLCGEISPEPQELLFIPEVVMNSNRRYILDRSKYGNDF